MSLSAQEIAFREGVALHEQGRLDEALDKYLSVLDANPHHPHALHLAGVIFSIRGNPQYARRLMESAVMLNPGDLDTRINLAQVLNFLGDHAAVLTHCEQVLQQQPSHRTGQLLRAKSWHGLDRYSEALEVLAPYLEKYPDQTDALSLKAHCLHLLGRWHEAVEIYSAVLSVTPDNADVLTNIGHAYLCLQRNQEAAHCLQQALALRPDSHQAHYHFGLLHQQCREWQAALMCFEKTLQLHPMHDQALIHCARVLRHLKHSPLESIALLDRALIIQPGQADVIAARGGLFMMSRRLDEALLDYDQAIALQPDSAKFHTERAEILLLMERTDEAVASFRQALALGGDATYLAYALASLGEGAMPATAPKKYVADLFDSYAERLDDHLQGGLQYRVPEELCALVLNLDQQQRNAANLRVLDLGCGTGLCGPLLRPYAATLFGVDLSPAMVDAAARKNCYDQLICMELTEALKTQPEKWDLLIAADVFIYVGELDEVFAAARPILAQGGRLAFSVELTEEQPVKLQASRRYAHSEHYLHGLAIRYGFTIDTMEPTVIRTEGGMRVNGLLVVLRT